MSGTGRINNEGGVVCERKMEGSENVSKDNSFLIVNLLIVLD